MIEYYRKRVSLPFYNPDKVNISHFIRTYLHKIRVLMVQRICALNYISC